MIIRGTGLVIWTGLAAALPHVTAEAGQDGLRIVRLRCEYLVNPLGIDAARPRLSWVLESDRRAEVQTAYQVLAAGSAEALAADRGDLWDTGKVASDQSIHVAYGGKPLASAQCVWWKVRVWDRDGRPSAWSEPATWEMGLLSRDDWKANWISAVAAQDKATTRPAVPGPLFRRAFTLRKPVRSARAYVCGLGYGELWLNGAKVGDHALDPAYTRYDRRCLYVTYDVTKQLRQGENAAGLMLGNGWFNMHSRCTWDFDKAPWRDAPQAIVQIHVTCDDGTTERIVTDAGWKVAAGPVVYDCIRNGETYDARLEKPGWASPGFDDAGWRAAHVVAGPQGVLAAQMLPPIKVTETIKPVRLTEPRPGVFVFDLGQNIAGWSRLTVEGPAGARVEMKHGERLHDDGTLTQDRIAAHSKQGDFQTDTYILKGEGTEVWEPRFVYHGFRYVQVTGFPGRPTTDSLRGQVAHTAFEPTGSFECSNDLLNRIQRATLWSYRGNYHGIPTDCPHREKNGWTGDGHTSAEQAMVNFDNAAAYTKWMDDFHDEQRDSGELPGIVPTSGWGYHWGNGPAWDSAYLLVPWYLYLYDGDTRILERHYDRFKRYVDYLTTKAKDGIVSIGLGDWVPWKDKTPEAVTSTGYYYVDAVIVAKVARMLGRTDDAEKYGALAGRIRKAFNDAFVDRATGKVANGTQTAMSCALYQGLAEPGDRAAILRSLVANIEARDGHIDTGLLGTKYLLRALSDNGRADVAYRVASQKTQPGWGWWIEQGATTLWEDWKGEASLNHIFFGDISGWFYETLAGIRIDPEQPGFKHVIIRPHVVGDLTHVRARTLSIRGMVASEWMLKDGAFTLAVTIPVNSAATVFVPAADAKQVKEGDAPAAEAEGVQFLRTEDGCAVFRTGSGSYRFTVRKP